MLGEQPVGKLSTWHLKMGAGPLEKEIPIGNHHFWSLLSMLVWGVWWIILCHVYLLEISFYQKLKGHWFCLLHVLYTSQHFEPLHPVNFWHGNMVIWCHKNMETSGPLKKSPSKSFHSGQIRVNRPFPPVGHPKWWFILLMVQKSG